MTRRAAWLAAPFVVSLMLATPAHATTATAIFQFFYAWNDYYGPFLYTSENQDNWTMSLGIASFRTLDQQTLEITLKSAMPRDVALGIVDKEGLEALDQIVGEVGSAITDLRQIAAGVRPARLDDGLAAALQDLARSAPIPVEVDAPIGRIAASVEAAAYFVVCEALTNTVKQLLRWHNRHCAPNLPRALAGHAGVL